MGTRATSTRRRATSSRPWGSTSSSSSARPSFFRSCSSPSPSSTGWYRPPSRWPSKSTTCDCSNSQARRQMKSLHTTQPAVVSPFTTNALTGAARHLETYRPSGTQAAAHPGTWNEVQGEPGKRKQKKKERDEKRESERDKDGFRGEERKRKEEEGEKEKRKKRDKKKVVATHARGDARARATMEHGLA